MLVNIEGKSHLLGVPALQSSSDQDLYIGIMTSIQKYVDYALIHLRATLVLTKNHLLKLQIG